MIALTPRADRMALSIPIAYRRVGDEHWFQSRVMNLSESGTQPQASRPFGHVGSLSSGKQLCAGKVVRSTHVGAVAVRVNACRFMLDD